MHEESFPADRPAIYAFDATIAHCFAIFGLFFSFCAFAFLVTSSQFQPPLVRFGVIIFCVCAVWSATLAIRSIWHREDDDRAWYVLGVCMLEANAPLVLCFPVIFGGSSAHQLVTIATEYAVPLWLPALSFIALCASLLARWRMRIRERTGQKFSRRDCIRLGAFWATIVSLPLLLVAPILLFLYALAPIRSFTPMGTPSTYPTDWRATVLEQTPRIVPDTLVRMKRGLRLGLSREMHQSLEVHGLLSSEYLLEIIETGKDSRNAEFMAFIGLTEKYPEVALQLARRIWAEPYSYKRRGMVANAATVFGRRGSTSELSRILAESPAAKDLRRTFLMNCLSYRKRSDLSEDIRRIADDRSAMDRLSAIGAFAPFSSPSDLEPLWFNFVETASEDQHTLAGSGMNLPKLFIRPLCLRALQDRRTVVLRCWLNGISFGEEELRQDRALMKQLLELSQHSDLRIRRGALRALSDVLELKVSSQSIPYIYEDQNYDEPGWWESDSTHVETQAELDMSEHVRSRANDVLHQTDESQAQ